MEVIGCVSGLLTVIGTVTAVAKRLNEVRDKYNNVALNTTLVASQLSTIRAALQAIAEWRSTDHTSSRPSRQLDEDLAVSLNCCAILIGVIDLKLGEAGYTPGLQDKIKHLWLEDTLKEYVSNLEGQVRALQLLLTIFQCRTVTEQRHKLELEENRSIIENVRAETASLRFENGNFHDAASILSMDPSVNFDVDSVLLRSPAYVRVYGNRRPRVPELPPETLPPPKLPSRSLHPLELPSQNTPLTELPSRAPPLPPRPSQSILEVASYLSIAKQEESHEDRSEPTAMEVAELPVGCNLPSTELEAKPGEFGIPVELPTARDSEDLGVGATDITLALATRGSQAAPTEPSQASVEPRTCKPMDFATISGDTTRSQSTFSDLYDSSIKDVKNYGESRPQSPSLARDAEPSKLTPTTEPGHEQLVESNYKPLNVGSIFMPRSTDSDLLKSTTQAPKADPIPAPEESQPNNDPADPKRFREDHLKSAFRNFDPNTGQPGSDSSRVLMDKGAVVETLGGISPSGSESGSIAMEIPDDEVPSSTIDLSTSHSSEQQTSKEFLIPRITLDVETPKFYVDEGGSSSIPYFSINNRGFENSLERRIDDQLRELQNHAREDAAPAPSTHRPPLVPSSFSSVAQSSDLSNLQPKQSIDSFASGLGIIDTPSRSSPNHTWSLYEADSNSSPASQQDQQTIRSSPTTTSCDTIDTVLSTDSQGSLRGQAQVELRQLQTKLAEAKTRGDTRTAKASIQRSIELIQRTYLSGSTVREPPTSTETGNKLASKGKSLIRLPSFSHLTSAKTSALIEAATTGNSQRLRTLLEEKVNVNARGDNYRTAQMTAAINGHIDCLRLLKEYAADEFAIDGQGRTVIHVAVMSNRTETVKWLLGEYPPFSPQTPKSWRLFRAAHVVKDMMSHKTLREVSDGEGAKPLHLAAQLNLKGMVELLLAAGADVEAKNNWSRTALHEAVILNFPGVAQTLISSGAKLEAVDAKLMSPLHLVAKLNHKESIALLLSNNAHRYGYDCNGDLPLHVAARQGNVSAIEALITDRTDLERTTKNGETLLHIACITNGLLMAEYLVQNGSDVNSWARPQQMQLALASSVLDSSQETKRTSDLPQTPLHYSCTAGLYEMSALLLDHGAWVNATPDDGKTPLMMAVESENTNLVCLLLARGAKVNATMPGSCLTAMHISARRGDLETTQVLFRDGANMLARTSDARTPWEYSATKIKDSDKRKAMDRYFRRINEVRIFYARRQAQATTVGSQREWTLQGNANPDAPAIVGHTPFGGTGPPRPGSWQESQAFNGVVPQAQYPQPYIDPNNDSFPEAPPAYTPGASAPRHLIDRAPVHRLARG